METVDLREAKWRYRWYKVKDTCRDIGRKCVENKEIAIAGMALLGTTISGTTRVVSKMIQNHAVNKEIQFKERTIYDRSLGRYVELKKPLTNAQALTIEERRAQGEKLNVILDSMGLLKK